VVRRASLLDFHTDAFGDSSGIFEGAVYEQHELVASVAARQVVGPRRLPQYLCYAP
jgi:hypothetical protein